MKRKASELNNTTVNEDNVLSAMWIHTANLCRQMETHQFTTFVGALESNFDTCFSTDIGEFLEEFVHAVQATNDEETHQDIQSLLDDQDIPEEILLTVGSHVNSLAMEIF